MPSIHPWPAKAQTLKRQALSKEAKRRWSANVSARLIAGREAAHSLGQAFVPHHEAGQIKVLEHWGSHRPPPVDQLDQLLRGGKKIYYGIKGTELANFHFARLMPVDQLDQLL